MKRILQIILLVLAFFGVTSLGYYAYILATDTLSLPIPWQKHQYGNELLLVVSPPSVANLWQWGALLDADAIRWALFYNGEPLVQTHSGELSLTIRHDLVRLVPHLDHMQIGDTFVLSAEHYNDLKKTSYRLPHDITLTIDELPRSVSIEPIGTPHEARYRIVMYGYSGLSAQDIRWYVRDASLTGSCTNDDHTLWNSRAYRSVSAERLSVQTRGQIEESEYRLMFDTTLPRQCIIAGVANHMTLVTDRTLRPWTMTGVVTDMLSPEYRMQSRIEYRFSNPVFVDSWSLYSSEYIAHRSKMKRMMLEHLRITPAIPLTEENIVLTPERMSIIAEFQEWTRYHVELSGVEDIYGRIGSTSLVFTPEKLPYLSVVLEGWKNIFPSGIPIRANIYSLTPPKSAYTMKVCRMDLEGYSQIERIVTEWNKNYYDALFALLESEHATNCVKQDIPLSSGTAVTSFDVHGMFPDETIPPGLYVLAFRDQQDMDWFDRFIAPRAFSVIDSHLTMKVDVNGTMEFLVTDIHTGAPKSEQTIEVLQNIGATTQEIWNAYTQSYDTRHVPLSDHTFSDGITLGATDASGTLRTQRDRITDTSYDSPYGLMYEYYIEGRYPSFIALSRGNSSLWYVVSTWNDGITGWNFGLKEWDYQWYSNPTYSAYIHTDRRLYLPGDTVHVHAIIRENTDALRVPDPSRTFRIQIIDTEGNTVKEAFLKPNSFWTLVTEYILPEESRPGMYSVSVDMQDADIPYIQHGWTNFQVEYFKKPTFTAQLELRSPQIEWNNIVQWIRKRPNMDPMNPWYEYQYSAPIAIEGVVRAQYYNGSSMKQIPFQYRVFRSPHYDDSYWQDCFWGCGYTSPMTFYTEWEGIIDAEGVGYIRIPVEFVSFSDDFLYTVEVTIRDPMTGEEVTTPATLLAKLPHEYKDFLLHTPLSAQLDQRLISPGKPIHARLSLGSLPWDESLAQKYEYALYHRTYTEHVVDDLRMRTVVIPSHENTIVASGIIDTPSLTIETQDFASGEYILRVFPRSVDGVAVPEELVTEVWLYITGNDGVMTGEVRVIPEKTVYEPGEVARVFFVSPFHNGFLYITQERGGVRHSEYIRLEWNSLLKEYVVDETFEPNAYIGAVAFAPEYASGSKIYSVGYGEIVSDLSSKRVQAHITPDKEVYRNGETVTLDLSLTTRSGAMLAGELAVMVVDESLIRLLGNIDLDIIPKFYQKVPFTTRTALTAIGMTQNRFLSRRGISGWSGDKWGRGVEIASRNLFKNTVYFNGSIPTDPSGKARVQFDLPDNVTDYRVIVIGQTQNSRFATAEHTLLVRRDFTLESHIPTLSYPGDSFEVTLQAFNATRTITPVELRFEVGSGAQVQNPSKQGIIPVNSNISESYHLTIDADAISGEIPYRASLWRWDEVLDQIEGTISVRDLPVITTTERQFTSFTGEAQLSLATPKYEYTSDSMVEVRVSPSFLFAIPSIVDHLISYPYGCAEQTLSALSPAMLLHAWAERLLDESTKAALEEKRIQGMQQLLRMQYMGGWRYWESDFAPNERVTPHIVRALLEFQSQGHDIPESSIHAGIEYLASIVTFNNPELMKDIDYQAELFATLAVAWHPLADMLHKRIRPEMLSRHGLLVYTEGLQIWGYPLDDGIWTMLEKHFSSRNSTPYSYWNYTSDQAIYAQLLIRSERYTEAFILLDQILRTREGNAHFISTQESIQLLRAILLYDQMVTSEYSRARVTLTSDTLSAETTLSDQQLTHTWTLEKGKLADHIVIRSDAPMPILVEVIERITPKNITDISSEDISGLKVERIIEKVDESKWVGKDGKFRSVEEMHGENFEYEALYRVTIHVHVNRDEMIPWWNYLTIENFLAGGIRPMTGKYQTESRLLSDAESTSYWNYLENRDDRIMAQRFAWYGSETLTFEYYFRPEFRWTYLVPATTAYFMYQPEIYSLTPYSRITIH